MEKDDQSTQMPAVPEETPHPPRFHWKEIIKEVVEKTLLMLRYLRRKTRDTYTNIFRPEGDVSPFDDIKGAFRHIPIKNRSLGYVFFGLFFAVYLLSGVYTVEPGEEAVARVFGKEVRKAITEGLHYRRPWPFEAIEKVNVMEIRRMDIGIQTSQKPLLFPKQGSSPSPSAAGEQSAHGGHGGHGAAPKVAKTPDPNQAPAKNQFFTGDENILEIKMNIQYRIKDTSDFLFNVNSPDSLIPYAGRAAVTEIFGGMQVDNLLTTAKSQIQKRIALKSQRMLDEYSAGLHIVNVSLQEVNPPKEVAQAFRDVSSAREEREEKINKAQGYWNAVIPEARGKAHKMVSDAEGYREETINRAGGDADRFSTMLEEFRRAKHITEYRLYLETIEKVLAKAKKFVIDSKKELVNLKFVK